MKELLIIAQNVKKTEMLNQLVTAQKDNGKMKTESAKNALINVNLAKMEPKKIVNVPKIE